MMTRRKAGAVIAAHAVIAATTGKLQAQPAGVWALPPARIAGGQPLIQTLMLRRSTREYAVRPLAAQVLSDLLFAAFGVNRPSGDRTAPYWRHVMVIDIYAATADGVWLYEPKTHVLQSVMKDDIRAQTGQQEFVGVAPLELIYVAHGDDRRQRRRLSSVCVCRYRLHRSERLSLLRLGRARLGLSRLSRSGGGGTGSGSAGSAVRDLCADRRIPARLADAASRRIAGRG
jgi:hypothetical protein